MAVDFKDFGIERLRKELKRLGKLRLTVGVQGPDAKRKHPNADLTVGEIAAIFHYGAKIADAFGKGITVEIPARPYAQRAVDMIRDQAIRAATKGASDLIDGRADTAEEVLEPIGEMARDAVLKSLDEARDWAEPLSPSTIARKGHDQPGLDTGTVREATSYAIRQGRKILKQEGIDSG